jgi:hypothetical protein
VRRAELEKLKDELPNILGDAADGRPGKALIAAMLLLDRVYEQGKAEGTREAQQRIEELEESRSMSCENPPENCDCAGCLYADDVHGRARGDK